MAIKLHFEQENYAYKKYLGNISFWRNVVPVLPNPIHKKNYNYINYK